MRVDRGILSFLLNWTLDENDEVVEIEVCSLINSAGTEAALYISLLLWRIGDMEEEVLV